MIGQKRRRFKIRHPRILAELERHQPCELCGSPPGHLTSTGRPVSIMCPEFAVLWWASKTCKHCGGRGEVSASYHCAECKYRTAMIGRWKAVVGLWKRRSRRTMDRIGRIYSGTPTPFEGVPYLIRRVDCVACKGLAWIPMETETGWLKWRCSAVPTCSRCLGHGLTGQTKEERTAQRLGDFGTCPECMGEKKLACPMTVGAVEPVKRDRE